jgi:hypothetical protein
MTDLNELTKEELIKLILEKKDLTEKKIIKRREIQKKYRNSDKGKKASREASKRYYKPTGNPPGRPRKINK